MTLPAEMVLAFFGSERAPDMVQVALWNDGQEVRDGGYVRVSVKKGSWRVEGGTAEVKVGFGPFHDPVSFDAAAIMVGTRQVDVIPLGGKVSLLAGMTHQHLLSIDVSG